LVARPAATSSISARTSVASLPSGPTVIETPSSSTLIDSGSNRALVITLIPRRLNVRSSSLLTSRSSSGTIAGRYSSSVTCEPRSWYIDANSTPTAPAPMMITDPGSVSMRSTSSLVTIRVPSGSIPGRLLTREPVARTTSVALRTRSPPPPGVPSSPAIWTRTLVAPSSRPRPWTQVTSYFLTSDWTPFHIRVTTMSRRAAIFA
jgi:hypothetical protein